MKRCLVFVLILSVCIAFFMHKNSKLEKNYGALYEQLSKENFGPYDDEKLLYINVGIDYIPYELIELFEKLTGISVVVDIFDSNEILEAKLLSGGAQYDIVMPTAFPHFARQLKADIYQKIDKTKINYAIFDKEIMDRLAEYDHENIHAIPFQFGVSGIGIDKRILDTFGGRMPQNSLAIIFEPEYAKAISKFRISVYESPSELFPAVLAYLGLNPETENEADIIAAANHLIKIRKYISKFTSYGFEDLASGNAGVALSTSGDITKIKIDNPKSNVKFMLPKEGASLWIDVVAIPMNARHINNIYAFLRFIFHPKVISSVTNLTSRANAVVESLKFTNKELTLNNDIYPTAEVRKKCYLERPLSPKIEKLKTRLLTKIKSMSNENE